MLTTIVLIHTSRSRASNHTTTASISKYFSATLQCCTHTHKTESKAKMNEQCSGGKPSMSPDSFLVQKDLESVIQNHRMPKSLQKYLSLERFSATRILTKLTQSK